MENILFKTTRIINRLPKRTVPRSSLLNFITITLVIIFITKIFQSTPFDRLFFQLQAGFIFLLFFYFLKQLKKIRNYYSEHILLYFIFLIIFIPLYSTYRANTVFDQSYYLGIMSNRGVLLITASLYIYNNLLKGKITFKEIEAILIKLGWFCIFIFTVIFFFVDPNLFIDSQYFAKYDPIRGYRYAFQTVLVTFITLYYLIRYRDIGNLKDLFFYLVLILFSLFIISARANILIILFVSFLILIKKINISNIFRIIVISIFIIILIYLLNTILFPAFISNFLISLNQAFEALIYQASYDPSASSRILQTGIILDFLSKNISAIWFGVGNLSNYFGGEGINGGYNSIFGYLYPTDNGLIGVLFLWGIFGSIIVYFIPVSFIIKTIKKTPRTKTVFIKTINYFLIFNLISSLYSGEFVFTPYFIFFVLAINLAFNKIYFKNSNLTNN